MFQLTPYLFFSGRCEEALEFYSQCFGGETTSKQYFRDAPMQIPGAQPDWVMHAEFEALGMKLMMSDGVVAREMTGNNIALSLVLDDIDQQERIFGKLTEGGHIMMPLSDIYSGAKFGKIEDMFGVRWQLYCELVR
ncbi:VOC family protein [Vibrio amylolyticus]|uniref:VOC family protein n=1 Tax=Vibrio TaxID=662 RepID=UPI000C82F250|nr:VOC family protein [Vibrio sp. 10N.261.55.A7]PMJ92250.1 hypothetical protein BCU12_00665 [Vibrio sp. 10N.261.55.A7]